MTAPLDGIRVVELASFVAAPAAGALLADFGAEVMKVEVPGGEVYRHSTPRRLGYRESDFPEAPHYQMDNRGKRSLALDLKRAATLRARRPELVFASLTGYGNDGPDAASPAFDYTAYWSRTGFMDILRDADAAPAYLRPGVGDHAAALALVSGILAALRVRDRTGVGQEVGVSLLHTGFYVLGNDVSCALATGQPPPPHDRRCARNPLWNHYATQDGRWLFLVMIESDRYWPAFCEAIGREALCGDTRFVDAVSRYRNAEDLCALLAETFAERSLAEWEQQLTGRPLIWSPVRTVEEALHDPQARATGVFTDVDHPVAGRYETVAPPVALSGYAMRGERPAPALGADTEAVLRSAGLAEDEIAAVLGKR
jgi:crotonobetainyl-CoA:carnitine CoA-transferase CaiB-like acyl-CoA transferase